MRSEPHIELERGVGWNDSLGRTHFEGIVDGLTIGRIEDLQEYPIDLNVKRKLVVQS